PCRAPVNPAPRGSYLPRGARSYPEVMAASWGGTGGLARLRDVSVGLSPQQSANLGGTYASASVILRRLTQVRRLWVVEWTTPKPVLILHGLGFTLVHRWEIKGQLWLRLFVARSRH